MVNTRTFFMRSYRGLTSFLSAVIAAATCQASFAFYSAELIDAPAPVVFEALIGTKPRMLLFDSAMTTPFVLNKNSFPLLQGDPMLVNGMKMDAVSTKLEPRVKIGHLTLYKPAASLMDISEFQRLLGADIEGAVGVKAFEHKVFDFNYTKRLGRFAVLGG